MHMHANSLKKGNRTVAVSSALSTVERERKNNRDQAEDRRMCLKRYVRDFRERTDELCCTVSKAYII